MNKKAVLSVFFTLCVLLCRLGTFITSPLWLDYFSNINHSCVISNETQTLIRQSQPFYNIFMQGAVPTLIWGLMLILIKIMFPGYIGETEKSYPKKLFAISGLSMGLSATLVNYTLSGSRVPPYLLGILGNFAVPLQFVVRFLILRRRPTLRKAVCAGVVLLAEFVCLLPTVFPWLESTKQHQQDGGSTGPAAVLWPLCFIISMVPYTVTNAVTEGVVKDRVGAADSKQINMVYYLFWFEFYLLISTSVLFFADIIPGFGTSQNIQIFWEKFLFNLSCSFGLSGCGVGVAVLAWTCILCGNLLAMLCIAYLLRYSEGANYLIVVMSVRSPLLLLFWSLFDESPFQWGPHADLGTYLSIASLVIMIPAVILYNTGAPEKLVPRRTIETTVNCQDQKGLLSNSDHSLHHQENTAIQNYSN